MRADNSITKAGARKKYGRRKITQSYNESVHMCILQNLNIPTKPMMNSSLDNVDASITIEGICKGRGDPREDKNPPDEICIVSKNVRWSFNTPQSQAHWVLDHQVFSAPLMQYSTIPFELPTYTWEPVGSKQTPARSRVSSAFNDSSVNISCRLAREAFATIRRVAMELAETGLIVRIPLGRLTTYGGPEDNVGVVSEGDEKVCDEGV